MVFLAEIYRHIFDQSGPQGDRLPLRFPILGVNNSHNAIQRHVIFVVILLQN